MRSPPYGGQAATVDGFFVVGLLSKDKREVMDAAGGPNPPAPFPLREGGASWPRHDGLGLWWLNLGGVAEGRFVSEAAGEKVEGGRQRSGWRIGA
jgi:hypothetical protein